MAERAHHPVLVSESMIRAIPLTVLVDYVDLRHKIPNGVVFRARRMAEKMGWSERKAYQVIASQKHWGLMYRDQWGHDRQVKRQSAIDLYYKKKDLGNLPHSHKTTLLLKRDSARQEIADLLKFKLAEARKDQFLWAKANSKVFDTSHRLRSKLMRKGFNEKNVWRKPEDHPADNSMLELGAGVVSMTMKELAATTMQSVRSTFRWKKRVRPIMEQINREVLLPTSASLSLDEAPEWVSVMSDAWKGTLVRKRAGWTLVLPNAYRFRPRYKVPAMKGKTKYQLVKDQLQGYAGLIKQYEAAIEQEGTWMIEALANPW